MTDWKTEAERLYPEYAGLKYCYSLLTEQLRTMGFLTDISFQAARYKVKSHLKNYFKDKPEIPKDIQNEPSADDLVQAQKVQLKEQNQKRIIADLTKKAAITEILIEKTLSAIAELPKREFKPIVVQTKNKENRSAEEVILDISDIQAGTKIIKDTTGGLNEFNWGIMEQEFDTLFKAVVSICSRQMELATIKKLHLFLLGDMVEGWEIFKGQIHHIDQDIVNQIMLLESAMEQFILQLLTVFPEIEITAVYGNHGRVGEKGENPFWVNWDYLIYKQIQKAFSKYDNIKFNIPTTWFYIKEVNGWKFLLQHGDNIKGWSGIPYYGIERTQQKSREKLDTINERFDYMEIGHLHTPTELPLMNGGFVTINGCWPGASVLALKDMNTTCKPLQWIKGVHPEYGVTWRYPIYLNGRR